MAEEKEEKPFVNPYTKMFNFRALMNNVPYDKQEEISDNFVMLGTKLEQSIVSYVQLKDFIKQELDLVNADISDFIHDNKVAPDELFVYQNNLIKAKDKLYTVLELLSDTLEKRYFPPEIVEKYSSSK